MIPERFTYPFCYVPCAEVVAASQSLIARLDALLDGGDSHLSETSDESDRLQYLTASDAARFEDADRYHSLQSLTASDAALLAEGKMLGVLLTDRGTLYAFSGTVGGRALLPGFVPPIFDWTLPGGHFRTSEAEISAMPQGPARSLASSRLQDWLFTQYQVLNAAGECRSMKDIFALRGLVPPGGSGDCAAPKLLQYAYRSGARPLALGEFWYGRSPHSEVRAQGCFYPACTGKCGPLLSYMLEGLDLEPNPLDAGFALGGEPEVIYLDDDIIVVNKPAGMLSVPGRVEAPSLLSWLRERYGAEVESCHRLDMDTSGLIVFARNMEAKVALEAQFAGRSVSKTYRARLVAAGPFKHARKGVIALPLSLDYYDRPRQMLDYEHGKLAVTRYEVISFLPDGEIDIRFTPQTGRTHQLRVTAASAAGLGRPIKGDRLYGAPDGGRLFLHAESLSFKHPRTGESMQFEAGCFNQ